MSGPEPPGSIRFPLPMATAEQIVIWESERLADRGSPWGVGKSDAEIETEVIRRVDDWSREREAESVRTGRTRDVVDAELRNLVEASERETDLAIARDDFGIAEGGVPETWEEDYEVFEELGEEHHAAEFGKFNSSLSAEAQHALAVRVANGPAGRKRAAEAAFEEFKREHPNEYAEGWATNLNDYKRLLAQLDIEHEKLVKQRVGALEIEQEARRRVAAKNYDGLGGVLSWDDLQDMSTLSWLVPGWIPLGETTFLIAKRNVGKSMFALALGFSVALGLPFLGESTAEGNVLFILGEGTRGFMKRLRAWAAANHIDPKDLRDRVVVYRGGNVSNDSSLADMQDAARALKPSLVVIDTYSSLSGVMDEISAAENAEALNRIKRIAPEAATLILHHPNQETEGTSAPKARGSSVLTSNVDSVITMWHDKGRVVSGTPFDAWLAISTEESHQGKQKDDRTQTLHGLWVLSNSDGAYLDMHGAGSLSKSDIWVQSNVPLGRKITLKELEASTGASKNTVRAHLKGSALVTEWPSAKGGPSEYIRVA